MLRREEAYTRSSAKDRIVALPLAEREAAQRAENDRILQWDATHPHIIPRTDTGLATGNHVANSGAQVTASVTAVGSNPTLTRQRVPLLKRRAAKKSHTSRLSARIRDRNGGSI